MITPEQKISFKQVLGGRYSKKVQEVLKANGVTDTSGKTHSNQMIIQVMNGEVSHVLIEDAIVTAVENQIKANKRIERIKNRLIQKSI